MAIISQKAFDEAVVHFFEPLALNKNLPFQKKKPGFFEIKGEIFVLRVRRGVGHLAASGDFLVTLSVGKPDWFNENDIRHEIGLGNFAEFHHERLMQQKFESLEDFYRAMTQAAEATEKYGMSILLGDVPAFQAVRMFVDRKIEVMEENRVQRQKDGTQFSWEK
jgi:hypothetical protein